MRLGRAVHRFDDGSKHTIDVDLYPKTEPGWPVIVRDPDSADHWYDLGIGGAAQARRLAQLLERAADKLEKRGRP